MTSRGEREVEREVEREEVTEAAETFQEVNGNDINVKNATGTVRRSMSGRASKPSKRR